MRGGRPLAAALLLAGCAAPAAQAPAPVVATTDPGLAMRGTSTLEVRAEAPGLFGPVAVAGIPCTLQAPGFRAAFATPATLQVPNLGARQPAAQLTCTRGGQVQTLDLPPVNLTAAAERGARLDAQSRRPDFGGLGLIATAMIGGLRADRAGDVWGYRTATVTFAN